MRRFVQFLGKSILLLFCLTLLAVTGAHVFLSTGPGEKLVLNLVNSLIPGRIACEDASISLLGESVELVNGTLTGPDGREIVRVGRLKAGIDLFPILGRRVVLTSIFADHPVVSLVRRRDGSFNIVEAVMKNKEKEPEEKAFEFVLDHFQARDAVVAYDDLGVNIHTRLDGTGLAGSFDFPRTRGWATATIRDARADLGGFPLDLQDTTLRARLSGDRLDPLFIQTRRQGFRVSASGFIRDLFTRPDFDVVMDSEGEIADLASLFGHGKAFAGKASGMVRIKGALSDPEASCRIAFSGGKISGFSVGRLNLEAGLKDRVLTLEQAQASLSPGSLSLGGKVDLREAFPGGFLFSDTHVQAVSYALSAQASKAGLKGLFPDEALLPRDVSGTVSLKGRGVDLHRLSGSASWDLMLAGLPESLPVPGGSVRTEGRAELTYPVLGLKGSAHAGADTNAEGDGRINIEDGTVRAVANLQANRVEDFLSRYGVPARGRLDARAEVSGSVKSPRIAAAIDAHDMKWKDLPVEEAHMDAVLDQSGRIEVSSLTAASRESRVSARGSIKVFRKGFGLDPVMPVDLAARVFSVDIRQLTGQEGVRGSIDGNVSIEGSLFSPSASFNLKGEGLAYREITLGEALLQGGISRGEVKVTRLDIDNKGSKITASGSMDLFDVRKKRLNPDPGINITASGDIDLSSFTTLAQGSGTLSAQIAGSIKNPEGTVQVTGTHIKAWGQEIEETACTAVLENRKANFQNFELTMGKGGKISGTGWVDLYGPRHYALSLDSQGVDLLSFPVIRKYGVTGGTLTLDVSGTGALENPQLKGNVLITSISLNGEPHKDVFINLQMTDGKVNILGESNFGFNGSYDLQSRDIDLQAIFKDTELEPYFRIAGRPELHGMLTGDAKVSGNARDIKDIDLDLRVAKIDVMLREDRVMSGENLTAGYHAQSLVIPRSRITLLEQGSMVVQAQTDRKGSLSLSAQGLVPLEIAPLFLPGMEDLMGTLRFGISVQGPVSSPTVSGDLYLDDAQYYISSNDQLLHGVNGHVRLEGNQAVIQDLHGMLDSGSFSLGGKVDLKDFRPVNIDLNAHAASLPIVVPDTMNLLLEADATMKGTPDSTQVSGKAVILEGSYYKDVKLNLIAEVGQRITGERVRTGGPGKPIDLPFLRNLGLDVAISRRGSVSIDNNLIDATLNPDLQITGTLNRPIFTGRVSVIQGTVTYQKRSFDITRGVINFTNPYRTQAEVDVSAQGKVRDWTITLEVTGPVSNLNINLTSNPAADTSTIMSLLATGKTPDELVGKPGAVAANPSSMLAEVLANTYGEQVKKTTGLDILQIESGSQQAGSQSQDIKITVGQKLTRRLTVKYAVSTGETDVTRTTSAEYMLLENILLNGFQDSRGDFGGDVQFRLEFR